LGITEEELAAALSNQFKPDKNKTQKVEEQEKERSKFFDFLQCSIILSSPK